MTLAALHFRSQVRQLTRYPAFLVPTLGFPIAFFALFGLPRRSVDPRVLMASYSAYAVLGIAFFQFGVGIAAEREEPWESFLRTLPVSVAARFAGRLGAALVFATTAAAPVIALAVAVRPVSLGGAAWLRFMLALVAGSTPLALLGIALGYWVPAKGALPVANLVYLAVAYAGGLWTGPRGLPHSIERAAPFLPTRQWGDVLWSAVLGGGWGWGHWLELLGFSLLFGALAAWGYRRDEGQRFR